MSIKVKTLLITCAFFVGAIVAFILLFILTHLAIIVKSKLAIAIWISLLAAPFFMVAYTVVGDILKLRE